MGKVLILLKLPFHPVLRMNVISIEDSNAESYSNKSNKENNTSISTGKKVNFRHNRKKQGRKKDQT